MSTSAENCVNSTGLHDVAKEKKEAEIAIWFMIRGIKEALCSFAEEI